MNKAYIETYGCQMNVNDTEVIFAILRDAGYERTESMEEAGLIMANTCSIRDNAEQRIWGRLEVFNQQKKARPGVLVGIVGCMAERLKDKLLDTGKVDLVVGPDAYRSLPHLLEAITPDKPQIDVLPQEGHFLVAPCIDVAGFAEDGVGVAGALGPAGIGNHAVRTHVVAAPHDGNEGGDAVFVGADRGDVGIGLIPGEENVDSYLWKSADESVNFARLLEMVAAIGPDLRVRFSG